MLLSVLGLACVLGVLIAIAWHAYRYAFHRKFEERVLHWYLRRVVATVATTAGLLVAIGYVQKAFFPYVAVRNYTDERLHLAFDGESVELDPGTTESHSWFVGEHVVVRAADSRRWVLQSSLFEGRLLSIGEPRCFQETECTPGTPAHESPGSRFHPGRFVPASSGRCRITYSRGEIISMEDPEGVSDIDCDEMPNQSASRAP